uniref:Xanthine dehydrogenase small subunit n=1 Tax=Candidatus Kentrum sp. LPFa TaxID=2126335 RepID=A0A450WPE1_9GAMM|nr:MAG: xanthine dehydrogenase small subunit [Candidatus Kentron sp. LPFa]VFK33420.1 MAG: xanthine dehydrogenase small subunit [Candidatus Kentron sp. LPFa]
MIDFILNDRNVRADAPGGMLLDFLRDSARLMGVREGCHEGACGACLVLVGDGEMSYGALNACLLPLAEVEGRHVVTIEGLHGEGDDGLTPIQQAIAEESAAQCGFCTPGIILALTGFFLNNRSPDMARAMIAMGGNICRCTGYQSMRRAIAGLCERFSDSGGDDRTETHGEWLVARGILPRYFLEIPNRLRGLPVSPREQVGAPPSGVIMGGGTDLGRMRGLAPRDSAVRYLSREEGLQGIRLAAGRCHIGAATTLEEIGNSPVMQGLFPGIRAYFDRIASEPIRRRITLGGNIAHASSVADAAVFFLATGASVVLAKGEGRRELALKDFFAAREQSDREDGELLEEIHFPAPAGDAWFHFEKVSKRAWFDIASVNSAMQATMHDGTIEKVDLSAGGVAKIPLYLAMTVAYLTGKKPNIDTVREAGSVAQSEIAPISDARGSADYKRLLLRRLIHAHFLTLFPEQVTPEGLP